VNEEGAAGGGEEEVLATAGAGEDGGAFDFGEVIRNGPAEAAFVDDEFADGVADEVRANAAEGGFDLGKFGHGRWGARSVTGGGPGLGGREGEGAPTDHEGNSPKGGDSAEPFGAGVGQEVEGTAEKEYAEEERDESDAESCGACGVGSEQGQEEEGDGVDLVVVGGGLPLGEVAIGGDDIMDVPMGAERAEDDADEADEGRDAKAGWGRGHWRCERYGGGLEAPTECDTVRAAMRIDRKQRILVVSGLLIVAGMGGGLRADWKGDIGWTRLAAELGAAMPTGAGVEVLQAEANVGEGLSYLPQAGGPGVIVGTGSYAGKLFYPQDGTSAASGHAGAVASYFYANGSGVAPGVTTIHGYLADSYLENRLLAEGGPEVFPGRVQNHSWVGSTFNGAMDLSILRRYDLMLDRDGRVGVVGLNNGTGSLPALMGNAYHGLVVGLRNGGHSRGGSNVDGSGRMKPDLVGEAVYTSYSTPMVAGVATLLMEGAVRLGTVDGDRPQVIKALLLAGASKQALPQWRRLASAKPYDEVFGAGEVNIRNAWRIQAGGKWGAAEQSEVAGQGWDFTAMKVAGQSCRYFFTVLPGQFAQSFSAALTWHRSIDLGAGTAALANLTLRLYATEQFTSGTVIAESVSAVDNVEHVFLRHLPPGQYALEVTGDVAGVDYGLAWQVVAGRGPQLAVRIGSGGRVFVDATELDPWTSYEIQSSVELSGGWTAEQSFRTGDGVAAFDHSWEDLGAGVAGKFYRLSWMPVR
jgi:hypothetical protein